MQYTIRTDDAFTAMHLVALSECLENSAGYTMYPALGTLTTLVELAGNEFAEIAAAGGMIDDEPLFNGQGRKSGVYSALVELQLALRTTEARLAGLIGAGLHAN